MGQLSVDQGHLPPMTPYNGASSTYRVGSEDQFDGRVSQCLQAGLQYRPQTGIVWLLLKLEGRHRSQEPLDRI